MKHLICILLVLLTAGTLTSVEANPTREDLLKNKQAALKFIRDHSRSTIDFLPSDKAKFYRNFPWGKNDFPGNGGKNQRHSRKIYKLLHTVLPTRRVNSGLYKLPFDKKWCEKQWKKVPGEGNRRLFISAMLSFKAMQAAAKKDGVTLKIGSAGRYYKGKRKNVNSYAIARGVSSHNYGLAVDFYMGPGSNKTIREISTRPFTNVMAMRTTPAHKWLFLYGAQYGWYPYHNEPWHWEFNPPDFHQAYKKAHSSGKNMSAKLYPGGAKATPTPTPPVSTGWPKKALITRGPARVRRGPGKKYKSQFLLRKGTGIMVLGQTGSWYNIQDGRGRKGWTHRNLITLSRSRQRK